jgi:hypothetical protein
MKLNSKIQTWTDRLAGAQSALAELHEADRTLREEHTGRSSEWERIAHSATGDDGAVSTRLARSRKAARRNSLCDTPRSFDAANQRSRSACSIRTAANFIGRLVSLLLFTRYSVRYSTRAQKGGNAGTRAARFVTYAGDAGDGTVGAGVMPLRFRRDWVE